MGRHFKCSLCDRPAFEQHLVVTKNHRGHIHVHGPIDDPAAMRELVDATLVESGLEFGRKAECAPSEIVFKNQQQIGDVLAMTCAVRDFKKSYPETRIGVQTQFNQVWENNPYIDPGFHSEESVLEVSSTALTLRSNTWAHHMGHAFRFDIENKTGLWIQQGDIRPDIWLSRKEYEAPSPVDDPYWIISVGGAPEWSAKTYPIRYWQRVVDSLPEIRFVQIGRVSDPYPRLRNTVDWIGRTEDPETGIRDLFRLFLHAEGSVGLVSMHMHLSASFNNPCVVIAGAREPAGFTHFPGHQYLETTGTLLCAENAACWATAMEDCSNPVEGVPSCVELIQPQEVAAAIRRYYLGGRLKLGKRNPNRTFRNVIG